MSRTELQDEIRGLKERREAVILVHNYQRPEVQDIADYLGDSFDLSRIAARTDAKVIVFCGVRFMAETAAILAPAKTILLPAPEAGCPLADTATAEQVRQKRAEYPDAAVVAYVNTSATVKAESDICCTSANAVQVVRSVGQHRRILFVPDKNLGHYAAAQADREVILWDGWCPTHLALSQEDVAQRRTRYPKAAFMAHPECSPEVLDVADQVAGTSGMLAYAESADRDQFIVGTECGMVHRLQKALPGRRFYAASEHLICPPMKLVTLEKVRSSLLHMRYVVRVPEPPRERARRSLDAMLEA